jgi:hypothetical protein
MVSTNRGRATAPTTLPLGHIVATPGAIRTCTAAGITPLALVRRHAAGDWGELCPEDRRENELALHAGFRVFSAYTLPTGQRVWVITEADRSSTCVLLPTEY